MSKTLKELKSEFYSLYNRPPYYKWDEKRIQEEIYKKKNENRTIINEVDLPPVEPVKEEQPQSNIDPMMAKILMWQQELLGKVVEAIDELKKSIKENKPLSPEEAKDVFNEDLKNSHFESKYTYEIYALKRMASDWSEERELTWHQFWSEEEAQEYGDSQFKPAKWWKARYKIMRIKKPFLVKHKTE